MAGKSYIVNCRTSTSISSLIGNLTAVAVEYTKSKFPKGYIQDVHIAESMTALSMRDECKKVFKRDYQTLFVQADYTLGEHVLGQLPRWYKANEFIFKNKRKRYTPVLMDDENEIYVYTIPNRVKVNFNFRLKLQTAMQCQDVYNYIYNTFDIEGYRYLNNIKLETEIPKSFIKPICSRFGWDYGNKQDREKLVEYLHKYSYGGVQEKINLASGNSMYAYNYNANILMNFQDMPERDRNYKSMTISEGYVNFSFSMEMWTPSNYIFEAGNIEEDEEIDISPFDNNTSNTYLYNIHVDTDYIKEIEDGKHLIIRRQFVPDINVEYDELPFEDVMPTELKNVLDKIKEDGYRLDNLVDVKIMAGNKYIPVSEYDLEWEDYTVKTKNPMKNTTYSILIYGDLDKLNKIERQIHSGEPYSVGDKVITNIEI